MTLRRHLGGYAVIGLLQWLVEYGLMLALSEWVMPVEPANVIGRLAGAILGPGSNAAFTWVAYANGDPTVFIAAMSIDGFATGFAGTAPTLNPATLDQAWSSIFADGVA